MGKRPLAVSIGLFGIGILLSGCDCCRPNGKQQSFAGGRTDGSMGMANSAISKVTPDGWKNQPQSNGYPSTSGALAGRTTDTSGSNNPWGSGSGMGSSMSGASGLSGSGSSSSGSGMTDPYGSSSSFSGSGSGSTMPGRSTPSYSVPSGSSSSGTTTPGIKQTNSSMRPSDPAGVTQADFQSLSSPDSSGRSAMMSGASSRTAVPPMPGMSSSSSSSSGMSGGATYRPYLPAPSPGPAPSADPAIGEPPPPVSPTLRGTKTSGSSTGAPWEDK